MAMEYVTQRFENNAAGLARKDANSKQMATQGYRIISEQLEQGHSKGGEQCCLFGCFIPCVFLAGRTPGTIVVTYGRDVQACPTCGNAVLAGTQCGYCLRMAGDRAQQAISWTAEAKANVHKLETLLADSIALDYRFNWQSLCKRFAASPPQLAPLSPPPPAPMTVRLALAAPWLENILPPLLNRRLKWDEEIEAKNVKRAIVVEKFAQTLDSWQHSKESFDLNQKAVAEEKRRLYLSKDRDALTKYWTSVLEQPINAALTRSVSSLKFDGVQNRLFVDCTLQPIDVIPKIEEWRYLEGESKPQEIRISDERRESLYRDLLIKTALIMMYRLFQSDVADALATVAFNGTINIIDRATGREIHPCLIAVQVQKSTFMEMNLLQVDTAACFKRLCGRISDNLAELTPVDPIVN